MIVCTCNPFTNWWLKLTLHLNLGRWHRILLGVLLIFKIQDSEYFIRFFFNFYNSIYCKNFDCFEALNAWLLHHDFLKSKPKNEKSIAYCTYQTLWIGAAAIALVPKATAAPGATFAAVLQPLSKSNKTRLVLINNTKRNLFVQLELNKKKW